MMMEINNWLFHMGIPIPALVWGRNPSAQRYKQGSIAMNVLEEVVPFSPCIRVRAVLSRPAQS